SHTAGDHPVPASGGGEQRARDRARRDRCASNRGGDARRHPGGVPARGEHHHGGELRRQARAAPLPPPEDLGVSDAVTLSLAERPDHVLVADCIAADRFAGLDANTIAALPVVHGGRPGTLGEFFKVRGGRSSVGRVDEAGARMRRGMLVVTGAGGRGMGIGMIAGTVVVFGKAGPGAGRFLKRGSIVALASIDRPATFRYACTYRPPHVGLLLRYLRGRAGVPVADRYVAGKYERYSGDLAELGKG